MTACLFPSPQKSNVVFVCADSGDFIHQREVAQAGHVQTGGRPASSSDNPGVRVHQRLEGDHRLPAHSGRGELPLPGRSDPPGDQERDVPAHQGRSGSRVFQAEQSEELHGVVPPLVPGEGLAEQGGCVQTVAAV
jgi:hypothetical protein